MWDRENEDREHIQRRLRLIREGYDNRYVDQIFEAEEENKPLEERREFLEKVETEKQKLIEESKAKREKSKKKISKTEQKAIDGILKAYEEIKRLEKELESEKGWEERLRQLYHENLDKKYFPTKHLELENSELRGQLEFARIKREQMEQRIAELTTLAKNQQAWIKSVKEKSLYEIRQLKHEIKNLNEELERVRKMAKSLQQNELDLLRRSENPNDRQFARDLEDIGWSEK